MKKLTTFAVVMLIVGAIDGIRNLPTAALFGGSLIFFFMIGVILFLLPTALVSAELSSSDRQENGIYYWIRDAFGKQIAFIAVWLQWINTLVWYPSFLSFLVGTAVYLIDPALTHNKTYLVCAILAIFWITTLLNWRGIHTSAKFVSICAIIGMVIPMAMILILGLIWLLSGQTLALHITAHTLIPNFSHSHSWISLTAIVTSFLGMELAAVHIKHMKEPQKQYPKALLIAVCFIIITMLFGALAIAFVLPARQINLVEGVLQAFQQFLRIYHLSGFLPILTIMIVVGGFGHMINWILSPAKSLLAAAQDAQLPLFFCQENQYGVNTRLLITQAIVVSFVCLAFLLMPSVNGSYWLLTDLSTQLYVLMYLLMFFAALLLKYRHNTTRYRFVIPGGKLGGYSVAVAGIIGCTITLVVGFLPPDNIDVGSALHYEAVFATSIIFAIMPALAILLINHCKR